MIHHQVPLEHSWPIPPNRSAWRCSATSRTSRSACATPTTKKFDIKKILERLLLKGSIVVKRPTATGSATRAFKGHHARGQLRADRDPTCASRARTRPTSAGGRCASTSATPSRMSTPSSSSAATPTSRRWSQAARERQAGDRRRGQAVDLGPADRQLRRVHLLRRSGAREPACPARQVAEAQSAPRRSPEEERQRREARAAPQPGDRDRGRDLRGAGGRARRQRQDLGLGAQGEAIKRRKPDFSESYYGFKTFGNLLEEASSRGLLEFGRDDKSGAYVFRSSAAPASIEAVGDQPGAGLVAAQVEGQVGIRAGERGRRHAGADGAGAAGAAASRERVGAGAARGDAERRRDPRPAQNRISRCRAGAARSAGSMPGSSRSGRATSAGPWRLPCPRRQLSRWSRSGPRRSSRPHPRV